MSICRPIVAGSLCARLSGDPGSRGAGRARETCSPSKASYRPRWAFMMRVGVSAAVLPLGTVASSERAERATMAHSFPASRFMFSFAALWQRLRWRLPERHAMLCPQCRIEVQPDAGLLHQTGHYRAQVFYARLALETRIGELWKRMPQPQRKRVHGIVERCHELYIEGIINVNEMASTIKLYRRACEVVHGGPCDADRARSIYSRTTTVLSRMADHKLPVAKKPETKVLGFALAVEGGAA
jgi:hypothetical protein